MGKISSLGVLRLRAITCGVIAAPHDSFDIEGVDVQDRLHSTNHAGESHADLSNSHTRLCARKVQASTRTATAGFRNYSQHRCRNFEFAETRDVFSWRISAGT